MNISVFGLGYVGCVTAACLARSGHHVVGVDVDAGKVAAISNGRAPIVEPGISDLVADVVGRGRLTATTNPAVAIARSDVALVCVGTPGWDDGQPDTRAVVHAAREIGDALARAPRALTVVLRSTVLPGTTDEVFRPALIASAGGTSQISVAVNPEFTREGSALDDFDRPPFVLIGADEVAAAAQIGTFYRNVDAPVVTTSVRNAELVKYASNAFHAMKVSFANEIADLADAAGADADEVLRIFAMDQKLNVSSAYLQPGFAFGGPCLPKDVRALLWAARSHGLDTPAIGAILASNDRRIQRAIDAVLATGRRRIGVVGLAFKPDTNDLRHSPAVAIVRALVASGRDVRILDRRISAEELIGENRRYALAEIPDLASRLSPDLPSFIAHAEVMVIATATEDRARVVADAGRGCVIIDLTRRVPTVSPKP